MMTVHKRGATALITVALLALVLFTGCPNNAGGGGGGSSGSTGEDTPPEYKPISRADLDAYLKNLPSDGFTVHRIEVIGLGAADLKGSLSIPLEPSAFGKILNDNPDKKVALKFGGNIEGFTDMTMCFYNCKNLILAPVIPAGVTSMLSCFYGCTKLLHRLPRFLIPLWIWATAFKAAQALHQLRLKVIILPTGFLMHSAAVMHSVKKA